MARKRAWTFEQFNLTSNGIAQVSRSLSTALKVRYDLATNDSLKGWTIARMIGQAVLLNESAEVSAAIGGQAFAAGVYSSSIAAANLPSILAHAGDWPWYHAASFKGAGTGLTPVEPENARNISIDMKSQRQLRSDDDFFMVTAQYDISVVTETEFAVSLLWLLPE